MQTHVAVLCSLALCVHGYQRRVEPSRPMALLAKRTRSAPPPNNFGAAVYNLGDLEHPNFVSKQRNLPTGMGVPADGTEFVLAGKITASMPSDYEHMYCKPRHTARDLQCIYHGYSDFNDMRFTLSNGKLLHVSSGDYCTKTNTGVTCNITTAADASDFTATASGTEGMILGTDDVYLSDNADTDTSSWDRRGAGVGLVTDSSSATVFKALPFAGTCADFSCPWPSQRRIDDISTTGSTAATCCTNCYTSTSGQSVSGHDMSDLVINKTTPDGNMTAAEYLDECEKFCRDPQYWLANNPLYSGTVVNGACDAFVLDSDGVCAFKGSGYSPLSSSGSTVYEKLDAKCTEKPA